MPSQHTISLVTFLHLHIMLYCHALHFYSLFTSCVFFVFYLSHVGDFIYWRDRKHWSNCIPWTFEYQIKYPFIFSTLKWKQQQNNLYYRVVCYGYFVLCVLFIRIFIYQWIGFIVFKWMRWKIPFIWKVLLFYKNFLQCSSVPSILYGSSMISLYDSQ